MKILVVEDTTKHQDSAKETLSGHEVTIAKSFDEAMEIMEEKVDEKKLDRLLAEAGLPKSIDSIKSREERETYTVAFKKAKAESTSPFPFDVVLTDMMMPESKKIVLEKHFDQVPYGFVIALNASLRGAKFVAMVTDGNHHKDAMSGAIDYIVKYQHFNAVPNFTINGAKAMFIHNATLDAAGRKDWGKVLADLTA